MQSSVSASPQVRLDSDDVTTERIIYGVDVYENTLEVLGSGRNLVTESPSPSSEVPFLPAYSTNVRTLAFECQPACVHQIALLKPNRPPQFAFTRPMDDERESV